MFHPINALVEIMEYYDWAKSKYSSERITWIQCSRCNKITDLKNADDFVSFSGIIQSVSKPYEYVGAYVKISHKSDDSDNHRSCMISETVEILCKECLIKRIAYTFGIERDTVISAIQVSNVFKRLLFAIKVVLVPFSL